MTTYADPIGKILVSGLDDWVSLAEARSLVQVARGGRFDAGLRSATLQVLETLLLAGHVRAGSLTDRFLPWPEDTANTVERVAAGWDGTDDDDWLDSVWFENTDAGNDLGRQVNAARTDL